MGVTWFDGVAAVVILVSAVHAYQAGLIRDIFGILAFAVAGVAALMLSHATWTFLSHIGALAGVATPLLVTLAIFVIVYLLIKIVTGRIASSVDSTHAGGAIDRGLGGLYGLARAVFLITLVVFALRLVAGDPSKDRDAMMPDGVAHAVTFPIFNALADCLIKNLPKSAGGQAV
jgi:membrane protein required for colicin V production